MCHDFTELRLGRTPYEMLNENPSLQQQLKILSFQDFSPKFEIFRRFSLEPKVNWVRLLVF